MSAGQKVLYQLRGYRRKGLVRIVGSFLPNGVGVPTFPAISKQSTSLLGVPGIQAVTWVSTGLFRLAFDKTYTQLVEANFNAMFSAATNSDLQLAAIDLTGATVTGVASVDLLNAPGGTPTDIAANAKNIIFFGFTLNESDSL